MLPAITSCQTILMSLCMLGNFSCFCCRLLTFSKTNFFEKIISGTVSDNQSLKQFRSRSRRKFCPSWSGSKLFRKVISSHCLQGKSWIKGGTCLMFCWLNRPTKIELREAPIEPSITNYKMRINNDYLTAYQHSMQSLQENDKYPILMGSTPGVL